MTETPRSSDYSHTDGADLLDALVQTSFAVTAVLTKAASAQDLSLTQLRMLGILRGRRARMADLATYLGLDRSTVTGLIDRAERRGLTRRMSSPDDGRSVSVSLTSAGDSLAVEIVSQISTLLVPMVEHLAPTDRRRLAALLGRLLGSEPGRGLELGQGRAANGRISRTGRRPARSTTGTPTDR